jgi:DNA-binding transcriptional LysR family regulator
MDRIDAMKVFVAALDEGSLAGAARRLGKSPAAVSRAIAFLENHVGAELLHRTTRSLKLSEAGERYAAACRRVLTDLEEADIIAAGERTAPRGLLTITAPVTSGEEILRPIIDAFLDEYPAVNMRLHLLDRPVNLIDEGIDLALRIAHLADSSLVAIRVGDVRRVVVAAPRYLAQHPVIGEPQIEPNRVTNDAGWEAPLIPDSRCYCDNARMLAIMTRSERAGRWVRMLRKFVPFSSTERSTHDLFSAGSTITTSAFSFRHTQLI